MASVLAPPLLVGKTVNTDGTDTYGGHGSKLVHARTTHLILGCAYRVHSKLGPGLLEMYRIDIIVDDCVIVEIKAVQHLLPVHEAQLLSYLKLSKKRVGLLINFNVTHLRHGIRRRILGY